MAFVLKSFDITVDHFMKQYGKKARYFIYDRSLNDIDTFCNRTIACPSQLFAHLSGSSIYYHKVTNYDDLVERVK